LFAGLALGACSSSEERPSKDAGADADAGSEPGSGCDSTWTAIQRSILQGKRCAQGECHGGDAPAGGLDLSADVAYKNLIFAPSEASLSKPLYRVHPGEQALSLFYLKLAAASEEGSALPPGGGSPMPVGEEPLTTEQLAAVRLWIRAGAPETGVVEGTQTLLDCELPAAADPNKTARPPVPAADEGFQQVAGPWTVAADSEDEVCFATYYDLSDTAPDWAQFPCELGDAQTCVGFKRRQLSQDAQSHHSIISVYSGSAAATDPSWGAWRCAGGAHEGTSCDPSRFGVAAEDGGADCGEGGVCHSEPRSITACRGYGPPDKDMKNISAGGAQSPVSSQSFPEGVYGQLPIKGVIIWNSHGFNLTAKPATIEQYNTFWYARPEDRVYLVRRIFDISHIFVMNVPPYQKREYCATFTLPQYARLTELSSHVHKRGVLWRTWLPPQTSCSPSECAPEADVKPFYESKIYNDPLTLPLDPPMPFEAAEADTRTLKYCATYDNGADDPGLVKLNSKLPEGARRCEGDDLYCAGGEHQGEHCSSDDDCGAGGACDACTVSGGVTTEDEMFILLGNFYVVPPES
jgi:hypothetical protein